VLVKKGLTLKTTKHIKNTRKSSFRSRPKHKNGTDYFFFAFFSFSNTIFVIFQDSKPKIDLMGRKSMMDLIPNDTKTAHQDAKIVHKTWEEQATQRDTRWQTQKHTDLQNNEKIDSETKIITRLRTKGISTLTLMNVIIKTTLLWWPLRKPTHLKIHRFQEKVNIGFSKPYTKYGFPKP